MGKYRIIIEGEGPHHSTDSAGTDANKVAKDTVLTLVAMGHKVETADFEHTYDADKAEFTDGETLLDEPETAGAATLAEGTGSVADAESSGKTDSEK